jgi:hypothetical protein
VRKEGRTDGKEKKLNCRRKKERRRREKELRGGRKIEAEGCEKNE